MNFLNFSKVYKNQSPNLHSDGLDYLEVQLAEHCNLSCVSCSHFSPLALEEYYDISQYKNDIMRLLEISDNKLKRISLMGGEPLLHPQCKDFLYLTRKYLPEAEIQLVTNAVLLNSQGEDFWCALRDNDIFLRPTLYPINIDRAQIQQKVEQYNIHFLYYNNDNLDKIFFKIPIVPKGKLDKRKMFEYCRLKHCAMIRNGKLYPCPIAGNIRHLINYFNLDIPNSTNNRIDIYNVKSFKEIYNFLSKPIPLCGYCDIINTYPVGHWRLSSKKKEEWIS